MKLDANQRVELEAWENRVLSPAEFDARVAVPMSDFEREDFDALVSWFTRRYPTAGARMHVIRQRMQRRRTAQRR